MLLGALEIEYTSAIGAVERFWESRTGIEYSIAADIHPPMETLGALTYVQDEQGTISKWLVTRKYSYNAIKFLEEIKATEI